MLLEQAQTIVSDVVSSFSAPILRKSYGLEYEDFCANVPRWIPHLRPRRHKQERSRLVH